MFTFFRDDISRHLDQIQDTFVEEVKDEVATDVLARSSSFARLVLRRHLAADLTREAHAVRVGPPREATPSSRSRTISSRRR